MAGRISARLSHCWNVGGDARFRAGQAHLWEMAAGKESE